MNRDVGRIGVEAMRLCANKVAGQRARARARHRARGGHGQGRHHRARRSALVQRDQHRLLTTRPRPRRRARDGDAVSSGLGRLTDLPYSHAKKQALDMFEQAYLEAVLRRTGGNVSEAARQAGLDRSNFRRVLKKADYRKKTERRCCAANLSISPAWCYPARPLVRLGRQLAILSLVSAGFLARYGSLVFAQEAPRQGAAPGAASARPLASRHRRRRWRPRRPRARRDDRTLHGRGACRRAVPRERGVSLARCLDARRAKPPQHLGGSGASVGDARAARRSALRPVLAVERVGGVRPGPHRTRQRCVQPQHRASLSGNDGARMARRHRRGDPPLDLRQDDQPLARRRRADPSGEADVNKQKNQVKMDVRKAFFGLAALARFAGPARRGGRQARQGRSRTSSKRSRRATPTRSTCSN